MIFKTELGRVGYQNKCWVSGTHWALDLVSMHSSKRTPIIILKEIPYIKLLNSGKVSLRLPSSNGAFAHGAVNILRWLRIFTSPDCPSCSLQGGVCLSYHHTQIKDMGLKNGLMLLFRNE